MRRIQHSLALSAMLLAAALPLFAQLDRGSLTGVVNDPTGAAVVNAKVLATHAETNTTFSTATTDTGNYTLPALAIGRYRVEVEAAGFKKTVRDNITVSSGATLRIDFSMEIGAVTEHIEVTAQAAALETDTTRVATNLTTRLVEDLPLVVAGQIRSVFNLALIAPEVKINNGYRIGGGQGSGWDMTMDGSSVTSGSTQYQTERAPISSVPVDAIAEFNVESSGMKAEYGRSMGVISFATKAGGNQVHGNAFDFIRNNAADARGFFAKSAPVFKQHDFGFTLGGPIYLPKVYNGRNRTFFFTSFEGFRNRTGNNPAYYTVPLTEMYDGDFRNYIKNDASGKPFMMQIYDPATTTLAADGRTYSRLPFAGNLIPKNRISSVAGKYISFRPPDMVPNVPGAGISSNYFRDRGTSISPWNKFSLRLDHQLNTSNHFSFLFMNGIKEDKFGADGPAGLPMPFNNSQQWSRKNRSGRFSWDHTISTRILNSVRLSYQREAGDFFNLSCGDSNAHWGEKLGLKNTPGPDQCFPAYGMSGINTWNGNGWGYDRGRNWNFANDVTMVRGSHTLKAGFFWSKDEWWGGGQHRPNGSFDFNATPTSIPGDGTGNTGSGFASFLLGQAYQWGLETPRAVIQKYHYYGGFFQDDWRVNNKLTLNLGMRWEYTGPIHGGAVLGIKDWTDFGSYGEPAGFMNFDPSVPNPKLGGRLGATVYTGKCPECNGQDYPFETYKKAWSPRIGLAYQVRPGTVARLYVGRSYEAIKTTGGSTHFQGLILNSTYSNSSLPPYTYFKIDDGLPAWQPPPFRGPTTDLGGTTYFWQKTDSGRPPEFYTWHFDIQHQLPKSLVVSTGYTGTRGVHLASFILNVNQMDPKYFTQYGRDLLNASITSTAAQAAGIPMPYAGFNGTVAQALKPFPQWGDVATSGGQPASIGERAGNSSYHAMTFKLDKRYSSGLTLLSTYVLSKMFSDTDSTAIGGGGGRAIDHYNRRLEKGLSYDDQTHVLREAFTYELPVGKGKHWTLPGPANRILGGWGFAGFLEYASGTPFTVSPGVTSVPGGAGNRAFINAYDNWRAPISGGKFDPFKDVWWNKAAFGLDGKGNQMTPTQLLYAGFGNATRNNPRARSPWFLNENITMSKNVDFTEKVKLTLRFEAFNIFNRVRMGGPDSTVTSANFGVIRAQGNDPRRMQFGAKVVF
ncbi:MAG: TonB-dependent receptor [Acidobacteria bacterium]|nr:TonB-dependent receptor [Acidobacteriota bacterium]